MNERIVRTARRALLALPLPAALAAAACSSSSGSGEGTSNAAAGVVQCDTPGTCAPRCPDIVCMAGDHMDTQTCRCVLDVDAAAATPDASDAGRGCVQNMRCTFWDHWDPQLCRCVPNADASAGDDPDAGAPPSGSGGGDDDAATHRPPRCIDMVLCVRGLHWDQGQCKCVPDADAGSSSGCD